jgi:hypothetical protein
LYDSDALKTYLPLNLAASKSSNFSTYSTQWHE